MKYKIVKNQSLIELEKEVNNHVAEGYVPVGGICITEEHKNKNETEHGILLRVNETKRFYTQPMFRSLPETQVGKVKAFYVWDMFSVECGHRNDIVCEKLSKEAGKPIECMPDMCQRDDKPDISQLIRR